MTEETGSALEHLDQLLEEGKISRAEYETLRAALETPPRQAAPVPVVPPPLRRLRKSWRYRKLGGVCGGLAEYFGLDPWIVRILFIIGFFVIHLLGTAILVYLILYFVLPWSEDKVPSEEVMVTVPWRFAIALACGLVINSFLVIYLYSNGIDNMYAELGRQLPWPTILAIHLRQVFARMVLKILFWCASVLLYMFLPKGRPRIICSRIYIFAFLLLTVFLIVVAYYPFYMR